jgi:hypothetical protein
MPTDVLSSRFLQRGIMACPQTPAVSLGKASCLNLRTRQLQISNLATFCSAEVCRHQLRTDLLIILPVYFPGFGLCGVPGDSLAVFQPPITELDNRYSLWRVGKTERLCERVDCHIQQCRNRGLGARYVITSLYLQVTDEYKAN